MNWFPLVLAVHLLGVILWLGGLLAAGKVMLIRLEGEDAGGRLAQAEVRIFKSMAGHGMMLAVLGGAALVLLRGNYYLHQGWFHAKLFLAAVLIALHVGLRSRGKQLSAAPGSVSRRLVQALHAGVLLSAAFVILLVFTQPF